MTARAVWVVAVAAFLATPCAASNGLRALESDRNEVLVELVTDDYLLREAVHGGELFSSLSVPGYGVTVDPGLPRLPLKGALVGVPFGADVRFEIVSVETERLGVHPVEPAPLERVERDGDFPVPVAHYLPDPAFYASGGTHPGEVARLGFDGTLRNQRVLQVLFFPFQYSSRSGDLVVNRRIVARVTWDDVRAPAGRTAAVADEGAWEGLYANTIVNYADARDFRSRPAPRRAHLKTDLTRFDDAYKLTVSETGMHRLDFADLSAAGLSAGLDIDDIGVYQRSYEPEETDPFVETAAAIDVVDADSDGVFDGDDHIFFYARSFEDQHLSKGYEDRYGNVNVYWFGWEQETAARMESRDGWHDAPGLTPPSSFRDTLRFEEDVYFDPEPTSDFVDFYTWTRYYSNNDDYDLSFTIYDIDDSDDVIFRARCQATEGGFHETDFGVVNGLSQENAIGTFAFSGASESMNVHIYYPPPVPSSYFTDGANEIHAVGDRSGVNVDWIEFDYLRGYASRSDRLAFTNGGEEGLSEFRVWSFSDEGIRLYDVTDPWRPVRIELGEENVVPESRGFALVFQDSVNSFTRYEAVATAGYREPSIERREPVNLFAQEADLVVISYDGFRSGVSPLVEHRRAEGHVVVSAALTEVCDEFGGGMASPEAIRSYLKYGFDEWNRQPKFALLVGDASEDAREVIAESSPNYVPTYVEISRSDEDLAASDEWYVCFEEGSQYLPQMFIGRLPVGGSGQLADDVAKIIAYEQYEPDQDWRNNFFFLADDLWSYVTLMSPYSRKEYESRFTTVCVDIAEQTDASPAGIDTTLLAMRRYTDPYHGSATTGNPNETMVWVRENVTPDLINTLSDGVAIFNFQGHGNKSLLTHENVLRETDLPDVTNEDKPFIFLGFSCQLAKFHYWAEGLVGDCIVEQMLHTSATGGAVASFASSATELLTYNAIYNEKVFDAFFAEPTPTGDPTAFRWPRWALGGLFGKATVDYVTDSAYPVAARTFILFGDPMMHIETSPPTIRVTVDGEPLIDGDYVGATEPDDALLVADIIDEVEIDPASITLVESDVGEIDPSEYTLEAVGDTGAALSRWYRLTYVAPIRDDIYDIRIAATDVNGGSTRFTLHVAEGLVIRIEKIASHPNPFTSSTRFIYLLNQDGADVSIRIFTVGGRLIRTLAGTGDLSYNEVPWDGTDDEGDPIANGVYLYVIEVDGADGTSVTSSVGRIVKVQ